MAAATPPPGHTQVQPHTLGYDIKNVRLMPLPDGREVTVIHVAFGPAGSRNAEAQYTTFDPLEVALESLRAIARSFEGQNQGQIQDAVTAYHTGKTSLTFVRRDGALVVYRSDQPPHRLVEQARGPVLTRDEQDELRRIGADWRAKVMREPLHRLDLQAVT